MWVVDLLAVDLDCKLDIAERIDGHDVFVPVYTCCVLSLKSSTKSREYVPISLRIIVRSIDSSDILVSTVNT